MTCPWDKQANNAIYSKARERKQKNFESKQPAVGEQRVPLNGEDVVTARLWQAT
jgi:hypothetical protein